MRPNSPHRLHPLRVFTLQFLIFLSSAHPRLPAADSAKPTLPPAPFLALTHDAALARAAAENKPLLLFFDGHWSERAREVRPEIFSAPAVLAAINDHALALRIDVLTAPDLTERYKISHVPTLVWVHADGTPGDSWINCEKPDRIRTALVKKPPGSRSPVKTPAPTTPPAASLSPAPSSTTASSKKPSPKPAGSTTTPSSANPANPPKRNPPGSPRPSTP